MNKEINFSVAGNAELAKKKAMGALNEALRQARVERRPVLLLLSGGSCLSLLDGINSSGLGEKVTMTVLDERYSLDSQENNMAQTMTTPFFSKASSAGCQIIDTRVQSGESRDGLAKRFNEKLWEWIENNADGKMMATVGIGPDGHLSGIMPYPEDEEKFRQMFDNGDERNLVRGYNAQDKNPIAQRVTTTMILMRMIDIAIVYVVGEGKKWALEEMMKDGNLASIPARVLKEMGEVRMFTDIRLY